MIRLITQYYVDKNPVRQAEIDLCLRANLEHPGIGQCVILGEWVPPHPKLHHAPLLSRDRPTLHQLMQLAAALSEPDDVNIVANSDIRFDETLRHVNKIATDEFYALGRWDVTAGGPVLFDVPYAQDAWVFRGPPRQFHCDFPMGYPGCDNRLAWEAQQAGYRVLNPARTIRAIHVHGSQVRNYPANQVKVAGCRDRLYGCYLRITPARLGEAPCYRSFVKEPRA